MKPDNCLDVESKTVETETQDEYNTRVYFGFAAVLTVLATLTSLWVTYSDWSIKYPPNSLHPTHHTHRQVR